MSCPRRPLSSHRRDGARLTCGPPEGLGAEPQCGEGAGEPCRRLRESFLTPERLPCASAEPAAAPGATLSPGDEEDRLGKGKPRATEESAAVPVGAKLPAVKRKSLHDHNVKIKSIQEAGGSSRAGEPWMDGPGSPGRAHHLPLRTPRSNSASREGR